MRGVVITTSDYTKDWLPECLNSLKTSPYEVFVQDNGSEGGFELAGIQAGKNLFSEFVMLMDTCEVKDISMLDRLFEIEGNVFLTEGGFHYMGKFVSSTLPELPFIKDKEHAIEQELQWFKDIPHKWFSPSFPVITNEFEEKHGRMNMVLETPYIKKWKARWA